MRVQGFRVFRFRVWGEELPTYGFSVYTGWFKGIVIEAEEQE